MSSSYTAEQLAKLKEELAVLLVEQKELIIITDSVKNDTTTANDLETNVDKYLKQKLLNVALYCRLLTINPQIDRLTDILLNNTDEFKDRTIADLWNR
jgi:hypothetical protein